MGLPTCEPGGRLVVRAGVRAPFGGDEPLRPRALRVTRLSGNLWVRLVDMGPALAGRRYAMSGTVLLEIGDGFCPWDAGRWMLEVGPGGARVARAGGAAPPDLALDVATLSASSRGASLMLLARAGLVEERVPGSTAESRGAVQHAGRSAQAIGF